MLDTISLIDQSFPKYKVNVFILNTGRCGSSTFIKACQHITNYSAGHETLLSKTGSHRLNYADNHIEADNRLSWLLGRLDQQYGDSAYYVHLQRDLNKTVKSFAKRIDFGILKAYEKGILMHDTHLLPAEEIAADYIQTLDANIELFLKDKSKKMRMSLENVNVDFPNFWHNINADGDLDKALNEWHINYNAS